MISTIFKIGSAELLMLLHDASDRILWVVARVASVSILFLVTISCDRPTDEVSVDFTNGTDYADTLSIIQYDGFRQDTLVVSFVAKGQTARVEVRIVKQSFATLGFAGSQNIILLKPGADLEIKVQDDATFSFSGDNELTIRTCARLAR